MIQDQDLQQKFKDKLFTSLRDTGVQDQLQKQIRFQIIDKLQKSVSNTQQYKQDDQQLLKKRVLASLIQEYLQKSNMLYSLQIFLPECGFQNKLLQNVELADILDLQDKDFVKNSNVSVIDQIIEMFLSRKKGKQTIKCDSTTQTEYGDEIMNLENKLQIIDTQYREKMNQQIVPTIQSIEDRMNKYKKDLEQRMKADMDAEIVRIRQFEIANMRLEEQERLRQENQAYREELDQRYLEKFNKLREREKDTMEVCSNKMKDLETYNYDHRQRIQRDMELLKLKEEEVTKQQKLNEEKVKVEQLKVEALQKELKNKIRELDDLKLKEEKKFETEKELAKIEVYKEVQGDHLDIIKKKKTLDEELYEVNKLKDTLNSVKDQNKNLTQENNNLLDNLQELKKSKKELEENLKQARDNLFQITESYRREQNNLQLQSERTKQKEDEIDFLKQTIKDKDEVINQTKQNYVEQIKKYNNEIDSYQRKIDKLETEARKQRKDLTEYEDMVKKGVGQPVGAQYMIQKYPLDESLTKSGINKSFFSKMGQVDSFIKKINEDRDKKLQELQRDNDLVEKMTYNMKFPNNYDIMGSALEQNQFQKQLKRDNLENNSYLLNKAEMTKSLYDTSQENANNNKLNLIEQVHYQQGEEQTENQLMNKGDSFNESGSSLKGQRIFNEIKKSREIYPSDNEKQLQQEPSYRIRKEEQKPIEQTTKQVGTQLKLDENQSGQIQPYDFDKKQQKDNQQEKKKENLFEKKQENSSSNKKNKQIMEQESPQFYQLEEKSSKPFNKKEQVSVNAKKTTFQLPEQKEQISSQQNKKPATSSKKQDIQKSNEKDKKASSNTKPPAKQEPSEEDYLEEPVEEIPMEEYI